MSKLITPDMALRDQEELNGMSVHEDEAGGLNEGSELYEPVLFNFPAFPDDAAQVSEEFATVVSLEARLNDLLYLAADIERTQGMSQGFALEAQKLLPGFGGVPLGYYTEQPSATRLKVSLESIAKGIWALITAAAAAILALIRKIFSFFSRSKDNGKEGDQSSAVAAVDAKAEGAKADAEAMTKVDGVMANANKLLRNAGITLKDANGNAFACDSLQAVIDHLFTDEERFGRAKQFLQSTDPVLHDIINHGKYSQTSAELSAKLAVANATLLSKMDLIDGAIRRDLNSHSTSDEILNTRTLNNAEQPLEITHDGRTMTMQEAADYLKDLRTSLSSVEAKSIHFDDLFSGMATAYSNHTVERVLRELSASLAAAGVLEKRLVRIQDISRNLSIDGTPGAATQGVGEHLRHVIFLAGKDIAGLSMLCSEISYYATLLEHLAREAVGFAAEIIRKVTTEMRRNQQPIPEGWERAMEDLKKQRSIITRAYDSFR